MVISMKMGPPRRLFVQGSGAQFFDYRGGGKTFSPPDIVLCFGGRDNRIFFPGGRGGAKGGDPKPPTTPPWDPKGFFREKGGGGGHHGGGRGGGKNSPGDFFLSGGAPWLGGRGGGVYPKRKKFPPGCPGPRGEPHRIDGWLGGGGRGGGLWGPPTPDTNRVFGAEPPKKNQPAFVFLAQGPRGILISGWGAFLDCVFFFVQPPQGGAGLFFVSKKKKHILENFWTRGPTGGFRGFLFGFWGAGRGFLWGQNSPIFCWGGGKKGGPGEKTRFYCSVPPLSFVFRQKSPGGGKVGGIFFSNPGAGHLEKKIGAPDSDLG